MRKATNFDKKNDQTKGKDSRYYDFETKQRYQNKQNNRGFVGRKRDDNFGKDKFDRRQHIKQSMRTNPKQNLRNKID